MDEAAKLCNDCAEVVSIERLQYGTCFLCTIEEDSRRLKSQMDEYYEVSRTRINDLEDSISSLREEIELLEKRCEEGDI